MSHVVEAFYAINEVGDVVVSLESAADAIETLTQEFGTPEAVRTICVSLTADLPEVANVEIEAPAFEDDAEGEAHEGEGDEGDAEELPALPPHREPAEQPAA